jgi:hypothetical protein
MELEQIASGSDRAILIFVGLERAIITLPHEPISNTEDG